MVPRCAQWVESYQKRYIRKRLLFALKTESLFTKTPKFAAVKKSLKTFYFSSFVFWKMSYKYLPCTHCVFRGILSSAVIFFTHTDSCLQPHPANIESPRPLSQVCYHSKTKRNVLTPFSVYHYSPLMPVWTQSQATLTHTSWTEF